MISHNHRQPNTRQTQRGNQAFVEMPAAMGGIERYERRFQWFETNRQRFADALG
jgi:hypothetical protein